MEYRRLGKTELDISAISLGTWQVGGRWGEKFDDALAERIIESAIERGVCERAYRTEMQRRADGIPLAPGVLDELAELGRELGLAATLAPKAGPARTSG
jgi:hypothetical protein